MKNKQKEHSELTDNVIAVKAITIKKGWLRGHNFCTKAYFTLKPIIVSIVHQQNNNLI